MFLLCDLCRSSNPNTVCFRQSSVDVVVFICLPYLCVCVLLLIYFRAMAEAPVSEPVPSSSEIAAECDAKEDEGPLLKKRKIADKETTEKLEHRLGGILCCTVCLDLPPAAVFQVF